MVFARLDYRRSETTPNSDQRESNDELQPAGAQARVIAVELEPLNGYRV
jgi:hypothetical protein